MFVASQALAHHGVDYKYTAATWPFCFHVKRTAMFPGVLIEHDYYIWYKQNMTKLQMLLCRLLGFVQNLVFMNGGEPAERGAKKRQVRGTVQYGPGPVRWTLMDRFLKLIFWHSFLYFFPCYCLSLFDRFMQKDGLEELEAQKQQLVWFQIQICLTPISLCPCVTSRYSKSLPLLGLMWVHWVLPRLVRILSVQQAIVVTNCDIKYQ